MSNAQFTLSTLILSLGIAIHTVAAQTACDVHFEAGNCDAVVSGSLIGSEYKDYPLGVKADQNVFADLSVTVAKGDGTIRFNIIPPGSSYVAIYDSSSDGSLTAAILDPMPTPKPFASTRSVKAMTPTAPAGSPTSCRSNERNAALCATLANQRRNFL